MKPTVMYSYNNGQGSRVIATALNIPRLRHHGSNYAARSSRVLINWGGRELPRVRGEFGKIVNHPSRLLRVVNKLNFFRNSDNAFRVPEWTTDLRIAQEWLDRGHVVVERHSLEGQSGAGIRIVQPRGQLHNAPLYTKYIDKDAEYRLHVVNNRVIFKQQKVKHNRETKDDYVRSLHNGYVYREKVKENMPRDVEVQSLAAMRHFRLDFGAVDVITKGETAYVLEINSAPGIDPNSRLKDAYAEAFRTMIGD